MTSRERPTGRLCTHPAPRELQTASHLHPCYVCTHLTSQPVAVGIQRATDRSFKHPTSFQRALDGPSHLHPTMQPAGPLVHSKSRPSDPCHLPDRVLSLHTNVAPTCTQKGGRQALSFIRNRVLAIRVTSPVSRPSNHLHLHPKVRRPSNYLHPTD